MNKNSPIWTWHNKSDQRRLPIWVETALPFIGIPALLVFIWITIKPVIHDWRAMSLVVGLVIYVIYISVKAKEKDNAGWNHQYIQVFEDRMTSKISGETNAYYFNVIDASTFRISAKHFPIYTLSFRYIGSGKEDEIPLVGMSNVRRRELWAVITNIKKSSKSFNTDTADDAVRG